MLKFQKAVARNPKDYVALAYWGTCHVQLRNPKAGIEKYNEAPEINPAYEYARVCRADVESRSRWTPVPKRKTEVF